MENQDIKENPFFSFAETMLCVFSFITTLDERMQLNIIKECIGYLGGQDPHGDFSHVDNGIEKAILKCLTPMLNEVIIEDLKSDSE